MTTRPATPPPPPPRSAASRGSAEERDTLLDALVDALYEDRCLPPPQTDHALHVIAALRRRGFVIAGATAAVPLDVERLARALQAVAEAAIKADADNPDPLAELAYDPDASRFAAGKVAAAYEAAYGPDMDFDEVTENIETHWRREHITDGTSCWCDPVIVKP